MQKCSATAPVLEVFEIERIELDCPKSGAKWTCQIENLRAAFADRVLALGPVEGGNAIAFAVHGEPVALEMAMLRADAERLNKETGIKFTGTMVRMDQAIAGMTRQLARKRAGPLML